jgi:hypothetical protein
LGVLASRCRLPIVLNGTGRTEYDTYLFHVGTYLDVESAEEDYEAVEGLYLLGTFFMRLAGGAPVQHVIRPHPGLCRWYRSLRGRWR